MQLILSSDKVEHTFIIFYTAHGPHYCHRLNPATIKAEIVILLSLCHIHFIHRRLERRPRAYNHYYYYYDNNTMSRKIYGYIPFHGVAVGEAKSRAVEKSSGFHYY